MKTIKWILILFLLQACTKGGGNIYVEGRVYNPVTGEGISDVELRLYRPEMGGTIGNSSGNKTVETVYTDSEGRYEVSHLGGAYTYRLRISPDHEKFYALGTAPNNFDVSVGNGAFIVDKGTNMEVDFEIIPYGYLQLNVENVNCQGSNDKFEFYPKYTVDPDYSALQPSTWEGCYATNNPPYSKLPSGRWIFKWKATKNGNTVVDSIEVDIIGNDSVVANINY